MSKIKLELEYGTITIHNLKKVWTQPLIMSEGYVLCYKDDLYKRNTIYRSTDKNYLKKIGQKLVDEEAKGKQYILLP